MESAAHISIDHSLQLGGGTIDPSVQKLVNSSPNLSSMESSLTPQGPVDHAPDGGIAVRLGRGQRWMQFR